MPLMKVSLNERISQDDRAGCQNRVCHLDALGRDIGDADILAGNRVAQRVDLVDDLIQGVLKRFDLNLGAQKQRRLVPFVPVTDRQEQADGRQSRFQHRQNQ